MRAEARKSIWIHPRSQWPRLGYLWVGLIALIVAVAHHGFAIRGEWEFGLRAVQLSLLWSHAALSWWACWRKHTRWFPLEDRAAVVAVSTLVSLVGFYSLGSESLGAAMLVDLGTFLLGAQSGLGLYTLAARRYERPGWLLLVCIVFPTLIGAVALMMPGATHARSGLAWLDGLFMATACVCGTGLSVVDLGGDFTVFGQAVMVALMLIGAFVMLVFGTILAFIAGGSFIDRQSWSVRRLLGSTPDDALLHLPIVIRIAASTISVLVVGGALLLLGQTDPATAMPKRLFEAAFMAVSALSNTGLSLHGAIDPVAPATHFVLLPLVVLGSLGLPVVANLFDVVKLKLRRKYGGPRARLQLSLQTKLVVVTTVGLYLAGTVCLWATQSAGNPRLSVAVAEEHGAARHLAEASVLAVTRTTGFESVSGAEMTPASQFLLMPLMLIGGSPGSAAGGAKTLTAAILFLGVVATLRGNRSLEAFGRTVPEDVVRLAGALMLLSFSIASIATLLLYWTEYHPFEHILFEATSAAANAGMSMGITDRLSDGGRLVLIATMIGGRIGPLWLLTAANARRARGGHYRYPEEQVLLG